MSIRLTAWWRRQEILLFLLVFISVFFFTEISYQTSNYTSRLFLTQAMVDHGTFNLNAYQTKLGVDHAVYQGDYFSDKPPGSSLMMVPAYFLLAQPLAFILRMGLGVHMDEQTIGWLVQIASLAVFSALGMVALYRILELLHIHHRFLLTLLCFFGTLMFPFSTIGMGEMYTVPLLLWGLYWLLRGFHTAQHRSLLYSGIALSLMVLTTYQTVLFASILGLFLLWRAGLRVTILYFAPPLVLGGLLAMGYHWLLFDDPFTTPVQYWAPGNPPTLDYEWPTLAKLMEMLVSPWKGIFFYSPFLLLSFPGFWLLTRRKQTWLAAMFLLCFGAYFSFLAVNVGWYGGSEYGFRYSVPVLPFLCIGAAIWLDAHRPGMLVGTLLILSLLICGLGAITSPHVLSTGRNPLLEHVLPYLRSAGTNNLANHLLADQGITSWWVRMFTTGLFFVIWWRSYRWGSQHWSEESH